MLSAALWLIAPGHSSLAVKVVACCAFEHLGSPTFHQNEVEGQETSALDAQERCCPKASWPTLLPGMCSRHHRLERDKSTSTQVDQGSPDRPKREQISVPLLLSTRAAQTTKGFQHSLAHSPASRQEAEGPALAPHLPRCSWRSWPALQRGRPPLAQLPGPQVPVLLFLTPLAGQTDLATRSHRQRDLQLDSVVVIWVQGR